MSNRGQIKTIAELRRFMTAGNATITVVSRKTLLRFTFKLLRKEPEPVVTPRRPSAYNYRVDTDLIFVRLLNGADNESDYTFLGTLFPNEAGWWVYRHSRKSRTGFAAPSVKAFNFLLKVSALASFIPRDLEVWHEGRCGRCGRKLTVHESIHTGFGPECAGILGIEFAGQLQLEEV